MKRLSILLIVLLTTTSFAPAALADTNFTKPQLDEYFTNSQEINEYGNIIVGDVG